MKSAYIALLAVCAAPLFGCAPTGGADGASQVTDALTAKKPTPFVRQLVGTYRAADAGAEVQSVELRSTGHYAIKFADGSHESGSYRGPSKPVMPVNVVFLTTGLRFPGVIADGYGTSPTTLTITRDGSDTVLVLDRPNTADESLCDGTGGSWTDDSPDPSTGLYCVCASSAPYFIPSEGGCAKH